MNGRRHQPLGIRVMGKLLGFEVEFIKNTCCELEIFI